MARGKLAVGFAHPFEAVSPWFMHSLLQSISEDWRAEKRIKGRIVAVGSGPMVDRARNDVCKAFLRHPDRPDWLLMVDCDMTWEPPDLRLLFQDADEDERPVMGGLCFAGTPDGSKIWPVVLEIVTEDLATEDVPAGIRRVDDYPRDQVFRVDATGAAFLLIHRGVLERMAEAMGENHPAPWFAFAYRGSVPFGEDVTFAVRCMKLGIPIHVDSRVKIGHMKSRPLTEALYDAQQATQFPAWTPLRLAN